MRKVVSFANVTEFHKFQHTEARKISQKTEQKKQNKCNNIVSTAFMCQT